MGFICAALAVCFARAPWEKGWVGWRGGWRVRRRDLGPKNEADEETARSAGRDAALGEQEVGSGVQQQESKAQVEELAGRDGEKHDVPVEIEKVIDPEKAYEAG